MRISCAVLLLAFGSAASQAADSVPVDKRYDESLIQEFVSQNVRLTEKLSKLESDVNLLKASLATQENINKNQAETIKSLEQKLDNLRGLLPLNSQSVSSEGTEQTDTKTKQEDMPKPFSGANHFAIRRQLNSNRSKRQADEHVAFSAYVDHEVLHMGKDQIVQFQNILLNDGNGYNKYTGVFTVPTDGVYLLTFFVEDYHRFQSIFHMVVDRNIVTSAIADPLPEGQNVQGGNVIFIRLKAGNSVWVTTGAAGDNVEGYGLLRTSTFSGYLLYQ